MEKLKSTKYNIMMNSLLAMSSFIFPLITFPYVSRILSPEGIGKVSFGTSLISYFSMLAQLGFPTYGIRVCARIRDNKQKLTKTVHELMFISVIMTLVSYSLFFIIINFNSKLSEEKWLYIIMSASILFNSIGVEWLYKALEQYKYITLRSIAFKIVAVLLMFLLIHTKKDYMIYGALTIFAAGASNILNFFNIHKYIFNKSNEKLDILVHLKPIIVFFAIACAATIYTNLDMVMLGFISTDINVGYYNAAVKIKTILVSIITSLGSVLLPRATYYLEYNWVDQFNKLAQKAIDFVILIAFPLMLYSILFSKESIYLLSGEEFGGSILPMQIIMPTIVFIGLTNIMGIQVLVPLGKERIVLYSEIIGLIVNLVFNFILIPRFASIGAAIGTVLAEFTVFTVQLISIKRVSDVIKLNIGRYFKIVFRSSIISFFVALIIKQLSLGLFMMLLISSILFFGIYLLILLINKEPILTDIIQQALSKIHKY